jgi:hypothetical protein
MGLILSAIGISGFGVSNNTKLSPHELSNVETLMRPDLAPCVTRSSDPDLALKYKGFLWCYMSGNLVAPIS